MASGVFVALLSACSANKMANPPVLEQEQRLQPSGGVSGGALGDALTVFAVDASTNQALTGAHVLLGSGADARDVGVTAADGRVVVRGLGALPPAQTVTVTLPGYIAASWAGVGSAAVTLPLTAQALPDPTTAVNVSIAGYDSLPALAAGHYREAAFAASLPVQLDTLELENAISASCAASSGATTCQATLNSVPVTTQALLALVVEGDDMGTPADTSDDMLTMTGLGVATGLSLDRNSTVEISLLASDLLAKATIDLGSGATAKDVIGVPGVTLGGQVILYPTFSGKLSTFLVPTTAGAMSDATLWAVATSRTTASAPTTLGTPSSGVAWSRVYARGIATPAGAEQSITIETGSFLETPSLQVAGGSYALTGSSNLARLEFSSTGVHQLDVLLLPGQTSYAPPTSLGMLADRVDALSFDVSGLDPLDFTFSEIIEQAGRIAYTDVPLSGN